MNTSDSVLQNFTSTVFDKYDVAKRGWSAMIINIICLAGLIGYLVYAYVIIKYRSQFKNPFYALTLSMMVFDLVNIMTELIYSVPSMLLGEDELPNTYRVVVGFLADGSWFWCSSHLLIMAANRVAAICFYQRYMQVFKTKKVALCISVSFVYGIVLTGIMYGCTCQYQFRSYAWNFECQQNSCASAALQLNQVFSNLVVGSVIVCMVIVVVAVKRASRKVKTENKSLDKQQKREIQLVVQFLVIGLIVSLQSAFFWTFPTLLQSNLLPIYISLNLANVFNVLMSSIHPFLYILFGSEVRQKLFGGVPLDGDRTRTTALATRIVLPMTTRGQTCVE